MNLYYFHWIRKNRIRPSAFHFLKGSEDLFDLIIRLSQSSTSSNYPLLWFINELINGRLWIAYLSTKKNRYRSFSFRAFKIQFLCFDNKLLKSINWIKHWRMQLMVQCLQFHCLAIAFPFEIFVHNLFAIDCEKLSL